jgi:hypothetical protein
MTPDPWTLLKASFVWEINIDQKRWTISLDRDTARAEVHLLCGCRHMATFVSVLGRRETRTSGGGWPTVVRHKFLAVCRDAEKSVAADF